MILVTVFVSQEMLQVMSVAAATAMSARIIMFFMLIDESCSKVH